MKQEDIRSALIESTVRVIAEEGLDKATTKLISVTAKVNEVYIYRIFGSKESLSKAPLK